MTRLAVLSAAIISFVALTTAASAQYPPTQEVVTVSVTDTTPPTNSFVFVFFTVQEQSQPSAQGFGFGFGRSCDAGIVSQPGTDAFLFQFPSFFRSFGFALLYTGSTPGPLVVGVQCPGGGSSQVTVMVGS
jgi:hypothetical protein